MTIILIRWGHRILSLWWGFQGYPWYAPIAGAVVGALGVFGDTKKRDGITVTTGLAIYTMSVGWLIVSSIIPFLLGAGLRHLFR